MCQPSANLKVLPAAPFGERTNVLDDYARLAIAEKERLTEVGKWKADSSATGERTRNLKKGKCGHRFSVL